MIDIHNHILYGLDDGAEVPEESLDMARLAVSEGIGTIIATPHHANGRYDNEAPEVAVAVQQLKQALEEAQIPLAIVPGQEIRIYRDLLQDLEAGHKLLTLAGSRYMLIELPSDRVPDSLSDLIYELKLLQIVPVIAHPERNRELAGNPDLLQALIKQGALSQVTAQSVTGGFGKSVRELAISLCRRNLVHFIATDAHNTKHRAFGLAEAYQAINNALDPSYAEYYRSNAQAVLENRSIDVRDTRSASKPWYRFWKK